MLIIQLEVQVTIQELLAMLRLHIILYYKIQAVKAL